MPTSCSVIGCKSRANAGPKKQFFRFPQKRPKVLQQWLMVLDRLDWTPKPSSKICSDHFAPEDFLYRPHVSVPRLKPEAVPSIFPDPNSAQEEAVPDEIKNSEGNGSKTSEDIEIKNSKNNEIKNSKSNEIKTSKSPIVIASLDLKNQENLNKNSMKEEIKKAVDDDIYPKRPRRTSKINVKMKDFILLDDFRKLNKPEAQRNKSLEKNEELSAKLKSPVVSQPSNDLKHNEQSGTTLKPVTTREVDVSKVDAAKELLSILEDSDDELSEPLKSKNDLLSSGGSNNSQVSSSLSSSPENRSPSIGKAHLKKDSHKHVTKFQSASKSPKKISHSGIKIVEIASRVKAASCPIRPVIVQPVDSKTLKQKTKSLDSLALLDGKNALAVKVPQHITKTKGSDTGELHSFLINDKKSIIAANANEIRFRSNKPNVKLPLRMRTKQPSTDLAKTYFPIRCGENFFYFSYADLNPMVDLSKNNVLIKSSSKTVVKEVSVSANKSKPHLKRKLNRQIKQVANVEETKINEIEEKSEEDLSQSSEGEDISYSVDENNDETSTEIDEASQSNEANIETNNLENSKEISITLANDQGESVSDLGNSSDIVQPDDNTTELENVELLPSPAKKRKKRFKTVAEIVVRTDNTKPGEVPNVSIDQINKIVDLKATKSPIKNLRRSTRSTNEATNSVDFNDNLSHITLSTDIEPSEEELSRLAERITDTVKRMKLLDRVKGNSSKLTVLITTLPPVKEKEVLIIKKKNIETNLVQSRELQVVISSNKANESSLHGNIVVTNPISYTILPAGKNNVSSKSSNDVSSEEFENGSQDQEHPTIVCFQDRSGSKEASDTNSVPSENTELFETPNDTIIESEENENNSGEAIIHDHPYISPNVKYLLANPNVSINLAEVQPKEPSTKMKLSENEIIFRNKVSKKLRTLKENIQKKNDSISKLKDKIKYLERSLKEVKRNRKNPLKAIKKESGSLLKNDIFYGVEQLVDTSDFSNNMDYGLNNIELPLGLDENGEESDDDGERECASPITYLCEPAIEVPSKDRETNN